MPLHIHYPWQFDSRGRTAVADSARHVRNMIEEFLFTAPGERVNRPDFGSGVLGLVFAPNSVSLAAALEATIQAGLQASLGDVIELKELQVVTVDSTLRIEISYVILRTGDERTDVFERSRPG